MQTDALRNKTAFLNKEFPTRFKSVGTRVRRATRMLSNASIIENNNTRRESRKRRRVSERRRVFSRLGVTSPNKPEPPLSASERRSSNMTGDSGRALRSDSVAGGGVVFPTSDQGKIAMKIQFHIVIAPDNEPLIFDHHHQQHQHQHHLPPTAQVQTAGQKRQISTESRTSISEHINERLSRQNSSTRRRQQLLAMHQQAAQEGGVDQVGAIRRTGSISAGPTTPASTEGDGSPAILSREGLRSSTITGGMPQDEATVNFLARQQQMGATRLRQGSGSLTSTSTGSLGNLVGQHQTLMASSNNIRARLEGREHIYFKRDGQRFGHEFTLKLAVDKSYRCLLKVRPLVPVAAISIQGHHVSFVDCSQTSGSHHSLSSPALGGSLTLLSQSQTKNHSASPRHQSIGNLLSSSNSTSSSSAAAARPAGHLNHRPSIPPTSTGRQHQNSDPTPVACVQRQNHQHDQNSASLSSLSLSSTNNGGHQQQQQHQQVGSSVRQQLQQQLVKQQQQHQMMRHFAGGAGASAGSGGQLVYMFDWSAGRFEVNKNKARTQVHTVLKFKNGEILSLPLQVKFYEPECRQHLSWGSQLHFIDYDCQINSMGQISVDRIQYY